jgi:dGTPase
MSSEDSAHRTAVQTAIDQAKRRGVTDFADLLRESEGADPWLIAELTGHSLPHGMVASGATADNGPLPSADPLTFQWWFSGRSFREFAKHHDRLLHSQDVLCLGCPTAAYHLQQSTYGVKSVAALDVDADVVAALNSQPGPPRARVHDCVNPLPDPYHDAFDVVVVDAPWYPPAMHAFAARAAEGCRERGRILFTLPPRLTRPSVAADRERFLADAQTMGLELRQLVDRAIEYEVPGFERAALTSLLGASPRAWRFCDLVVLEKMRASDTRAVTMDGSRTERFSRTPSRFRVFLDPSRASPRLEQHAAEVDEFKRNLSSRLFPVDVICAWTTGKRAARIRDPQHARAVLAAWSDGATRDQASVRLVEKHALREHDAKAVVTQIEGALGLWENQVSPKRSSKQIEEARNRELSEWATQDTEKGTDGYRPKFQRDRDRVLWSQGFRALAHKTQVFPVEHDDHLRQRLAHSVEVMQLASTIGASFGLNRELIEAGALAHDIGHTPFGHAGEEALDSLLNELCPGLHGFNHYEHGVDVVRYLEDVYASGQTEEKTRGLQLSGEVAECILKHTFCRQGHHLSERDVRRRSKHQDIVPDGACHLEGQAVRLADKISYLVSDIEDGIRMGAVQPQTLRGCRLFEHSSLLIDEGTEDLTATFMPLRRHLIRIVMEDAIEETARRISRYRVKDEVRTADDYTVFHSAEMGRHVDEIWRELQAGRLHMDRRVIAANTQARRIVVQLTLLFAHEQSLIDPSFQRSHLLLNTTSYINWYRDKSPTEIDLGDALTRHGIPRSGKSTEASTHGVIMAKDFVASLTDARARRLHAHFFGDLPMVRSF